MEKTDKSNIVVGVDAFDMEHKSFCIILTFQILLFTNWWNLTPIEIRWKMTTYNQQ
jgi:hypothetical protein